MKKNVVIAGSVIVLCGFLAVFIILYSAKIEKQEEDIIQVSLHKCVDGDTAWFKTKDGIKKYRFLGIDAPEVDEEYGTIASDYTCDALKNAKNIEIEYDKVGKKIDKYNRELVWVYVDNELLENKLLDLGYAKIKYIYVNYDYLTNLYKSEKNAKNTKSGLWKGYVEKVYNNYYTITLDYTYKNDVIRVLENSNLVNIKNPYKNGCRFVGWLDNNYLFDLSTNIRKDYKLKASFEC